MGQLCHIRLVMDRARFDNVTLAFQGLHPACIKGKNKSRSLKCSSQPSQGCLCICPNHSVPFPLQISKGDCSTGKPMFDIFCWYRPYHYLAIVLVLNGEAFFYLCFLHTPQMVTMFLWVLSEVDDKKRRIGRNKKKVPNDERDQHTPRSPDVKHCWHRPCTAQICSFL